MSPASHSQCCLPLQVILDVVTHLGWLDVVVVVDDDPFSEELLSELVRLAGAADVCIARIVRTTLRTSPGATIARQLSHIQDTGSCVANIYSIIVEYCNTRKFHLQLVFTIFADTANP